MLHLLDQYLDSKKNAWSKTTLKSEASRLRRLLLQLPNVTVTAPDIAFQLLSTTRLKYTMTTTWTRLVNFYDWMIDNDHAKAPNPFARWKKDNAKQFKNVYQRQTPEISFSEAEGAIQRLSDQSIKNRALLLLYSGLRYSECDTITNGIVIGKGSKSREVYLPEIEGEIYKGPYWNFWNELKKVGLKPHLLRKLFATQANKCGLNEFDLCKIMGWESIETAKSYVAPKKSEELKEFVKREIQG